jgi:transposase
MGLFQKIITRTVNESTIDNISIKRLAPKCKEWKIDTLLISTRKTCPCCGQYNNKIYSLYGWSKKYPKIPDALLKRKCVECGVVIGACMYLK